MVAMAPMACSVRVETASPIAPSDAIAAATYKVTNSSRSRPSGSETVVPDSSVTGPTGNSAAPATRATADTTNVAHNPNVTIAPSFTASSRVRPGRHREQVAQRAVAGLAGHRIARHHRDHHRQHQDEQGA